MTAQRRKWIRTQSSKKFLEQYSPFPFVEDTHMQTSFGHLDDYSAIYYTYMWSLVFAKDIFSQFDKTNLLATDIRKTLPAVGA